MKTPGIFFCAMIALAGSLQSCLKEKACPVPAASLFAVVQDKNYDNIGEIDQLVPMNENLAFRSYVPQLNTRYAALGGPSARSLEQSAAPSGPEARHRLDITPVNPGRYEVTLFGNPDAAPDPAFSVELHPQGAESSDIYYGRDTLDFPLPGDRTIPLVRAKGKLLLLYENFPDGITRIDVLTEGISKSLDNTLNYTGTTQVQKTFLLPGSATSGQLEFLLAPTPAPGTVTLVLYDQSGNPVNILSNIALNIQRNRITAARVEYDPGQGSWEIWITVEGQWVRVHDLTIQ